MTRLEQALKALDAVRSYTQRLLAGVDESLWFRRPSEGVTHIAWQVGHLAMAEYRLCLDRVRGARPDDAAFVSDAFLSTFARESVPNADPAANPSPSELRAVFNAVHARVMADLCDLADTELDAPTLKPHPVFNTKLGALQWCGYHEMLHAGQIGLLRRLLGLGPMW